MSYSYYQYILVFKNNLCGYSDKNNKSSNSNNSLNAIRVEANTNSKGSSLFKSKAEGASLLFLVYVS